MFFYVLLILSVLFSFSIKKILKKTHNDAYIHSVGLILEILLITLFIFRYDVGWDYPNYYHLVLQEEAPSSRLEPFSYFFVVIARFYRSPELLFILFGLPTYLLIFNLLRKHSCNFEFSLLIYLCLFLFDSFGLVRQALAVAITFGGFKYIEKKSLLKYFLIVGVAVCFHYSAIVSIFIYPLFHMKMKFFIVSVLLMFLLKEGMIYLIEADGTYAVYLNVEELMSGGSKVFLFFYFLGIFLFLFSIRGNSLFFHKGFFQIFFFALLFPIMFGDGIAIRVVSYYVIYLTLLIPLIFRYYPVMRIFIGCCCLFYFFAMLWISSENPIKSPYIPYKNIIFNDNEPFKN